MLLHTPLTMTIVAWLFDRPTFATTRRASLLHREKALLPTHLTNTTTGSALSLFCTWLGTITMAGIAILETAETNFSRMPHNGFFEIERQLIAHIGTTINSAPTTALSTTTENIAEHIAEDVAKAAWSARTRRIIDTRMAVLIVGCPFLRIGKYFVGFLGFLELGLSFIIIGITIRMVFHGQAAISLLEVSV